MAFRFSIKAGAGRPQTGAANTVLRVGVCSGGVANQRYQLDAGQDPTPAVGYGPLSASGWQASRLGGAPQILLKVAATTPGTISSVTASPSSQGPLITITALASAFDGLTTPWDAYRPRVKVVTAGPVGTARVQVNLDGGTSYPYTYDVPAEAPATLRGVADLSTLSYPFAGLDTKHLNFTAPSAATVTFSGSFATPQAIVDQFNTLAAAGAYGKLASDAGAFPVQLADGDTFIGAVDEGSPVTKTIVAHPATLTLTGGSYAAGGAGDSVTFDVVVMGSHVVTTLDLSSVGNTEQDYIDAINTVPGLSAADASGDIAITTDQAGSAAAASITAYGGSAATKLGGPAAPAAFTHASGSNVPNVALVTETDFAAAVSYTGSVMSADTTNHKVTWTTNAAGASPKGVQFTGGTGVSKITGFDTSEHNGGSSTIAVRARLVQGRFFETYTTSAGAGVTQTIDAAASDADTILGFSSADANLTGTGSDSIIVLPGTGLQLGFPSSSDYVADVVYSAATTAPRCSQADIDTALDAANTDLTLAWGVTEIVQEPVDAPDLRAYCDDLDAILAGWEAQTEKRFGVYILGADLDAPDGSIKVSMSGHVSRYGAAVVGDIYTTETTPMPKGSMRRSACRPLGIRLAAQRLSEDPGVVPELPACSLLAPDGTTKARNDATATTKMGGSQGPGFTCLESQAGLPYFKRGVTRAGASSVFVDLGVARMSAYASAIIFDRLRTLRNRDYDLNADGTLQESDAAALEDAFEGELQRLLVQGKHASAVQVSVDRTEKVSDTRNVTITWTVQTRGQGEDITGTLSIVGDLTIDGTEVQAA